jgi:NinB protein
MIQDGSFFCDWCPHCGNLIQQRTSPQSAALYHLLSRTSKERDWPAGSGKYLPVKPWQQLFIASWERAAGRNVLLLPAIDGVGFTGHGIDIVFERGSRLAKKEMSELTEAGTAMAVMDLEIEIPPRRE